MPIPRWTHHLRTAALALLLSAPALYAEGLDEDLLELPGAEPTPRVLKTGGRMKVFADETSRTIRRHVGGPAVWQLLQQTGRHCRAFVHGDWSRLRQGGLTADDYTPVSPPDLGAALGLATVYGPDTAGWFLAAGRRVHVKTTDPTRNYVTFSYESLARLGWAVGVTSQTRATARIYYEARDEPPLTLEAVIDRAVAETQDASAWLVAGQVDFLNVRGQALKRAPTPDHPLNDIADRSRPDRSLFNPTEAQDAPGLVVALVVDRGSRAGPAARDLAGRFFPRDAGGLRLMRTHYALWRPPAPPIDPAVPFQALWDVERRSGIPHVEVVREAVEEASRVREAHLSVWAIDEVAECCLYQEPDFVELTDVDPSILVDQVWATSRTFVGAPIYDTERLLLRRPVAEALARVQKRLRAQGYGLKVYDAYRPLSVTQRLWNLMPEAGRKGYLAAPNFGSRHNRGAAVDLTLVDESGREIEMPSDYLDFERASHRLPEEMTPEARRNLEILTEAMQAEGFTTIHEEWWHYDAPGWQRYPVADVPLAPPGERTARRERRLQPATLRLPDAGEPARPELAGAEGEPRQAPSPALPPRRPGRMESRPDRLEPTSTPTPTPEPTPSPARPPSPWGKRLLEIVLLAAIVFIAGAMIWAFLSKD